jgi:hypothetical protein
MNQPGACGVGVETIRTTAMTIATESTAAPTPSGGEE